MRSSVANGEHRLLATTVAAWSLLACAPSSPTPVAPPAITVERAKQLAVEHFNESFAHKLNFKNPATGACAPLPEIEVADIESAKLEDHAWRLEREVLVGYGFSIRVARDGAWTAVESVYVYTE